LRNNGGMIARAALSRWDDCVSHHEVAVQVA
jgi:hypothetical protein